MKERINSAVKNRAVNKKIIFQIVVLLIIGIVFYLFSGQKWVYLIDDSITYMHPKAEHYGVMPVYPLFLFAIRFVFGEEGYLNAVVLIQSVIAIICTLSFTLYLQRIFRLKFVETVLFYLFMMMPFTIELPEACISHAILTEGLAYPFFYIYFMFVLQYIFDKKAGWLICMTAMAAFMGLIRSQFLFLMIFTTFVFVCVEFSQKGYKTKLKRWIKAGINFLIGGIVSYVLIFFIYQLCAGYATWCVPVMERWEQQQEAVGNKNVQEETAEVINEEKPAAEPVETEQKKVEYKEAMSQLTNIIIIRGFYEADEEDAALFDTVEMQEIFRSVYAAVDEHQYRYVYARPGLYMWRDLVQDRIVHVAHDAITAYLNENPDVQIDRNAVLRELGIKVLLKHFDRYLYHSVRLIIPGFISSVFFQIESIYWLCHLITLFLFGIEIFGMLYCFKNNGERKTVLFALTTVGFIILMVLIINLVFMGTQRYMIYAMGIFYCSLYLLLKEWGLPWIKKRLKF